MSDVTLPRLLTALWDGVAARISMEGRCECLACDLRGYARGKTCAICGGSKLRSVKVILRADGQLATRCRILEAFGRVPQMIATELTRGNAVIVRGHEFTRGYFRTPDYMRSLPFLKLRQPPDPAQPKIAVYRRHAVQDWANRMIVDKVS